MTTPKSRSERSLRILYVCPLAHIDGHPYFASLTETEALRDAGHAVTLLTFAGVPPGQPGPSVPHVKVVSPSNENLGRLTTLADNRFFGRVLRSVAFLMTFWKAALVSGGRYDVIHLRDGTGLFMSFPQFLGILFPGRSWIISLLTVEAYPSIIGGIVNSTKMPSVYKLSFARGRYGYVCQNQSLCAYYERDFLRGLLRGKVFFLPLPVVNGFRRLGRIGDVNTRLGLDSGTRFFLSFGALHPGKDFNTVIHAFEHVPSSVLVHAGKASDAIRVRVPKNVIVEDTFIDEDLKPIYFQETAALILSYKRDFTGTSSMLWEASRFGVPVIASDNIQLSKLVSKYAIGLTFKAEDPDSLRDAILEFSRLSPADLSVMRKNCEIFARDFSSQRWAEECGEVYTAVLNQAKRRASSLSQSVESSDSQRSEWDESRNMGV